MAKGELGYGFHITTKKIKNPHKLPNFCDMLSLSVKYPTLPLKANSPAIAVIRA
jgi:hypothetical protein